jgi:hypothetical protein
MTTKGARIKSTTSSAPNNTVKKTDAGIKNFSAKKRKFFLLIKYRKKILSFSLVEPYHCKGKFLEDFDALCRQAQISFIVPVVTRPRPPGTPMATSAIPDIKDKAPPKTAKGAANKDREATAQQHHNESEIAEIPHGSFREENKIFILFFLVYRRFSTQNLFPS